MQSYILGASESCFIKFVMPQPPSFLNMPAKVHVINHNKQSCKIIFIFQYIYYQAKVMAVGFTGLIQTVARQLTHSKPFATWKLSVEVGP